MVFFREGNIDLTLLADKLTDKLLLKGVNKGMGTDHKRVILALSTVKTLAVHIAVKVNRHAVSVLNPSVIHCNQTGILLSDAVDFSLNVLIRNLSFCFLHLNALVLAECDLRLAATVAV